MSRLPRERIRQRLDLIRQELIESLAPIADTDLDFAPRPDMKSYRGLLKEIGALEVESLAQLKSGGSNWDEAEHQVTGETVSQLLVCLGRIRLETLAWIDAISDEALQTPVVIPSSWSEHGGSTEVEPEEIIRWIATHEYYHLGQIVSYRWIQGHNPYSK